MPRMTSAPFVMSATRSRAIGVLSMVPFAYLVFFVFAIMGAAFTREPNFISDLFPAFMVVHLGVMAITYGLIGYYIYLAVKRGLSGPAIAVWSAALFMGNMLVFPVAWYFLARQRPEDIGAEWALANAHAHGGESVGC